MEEAREFAVVISKLKTENKDSTLVNLFKRIVNSARVANFIAMLTLVLMTASHCQSQSAVKLSDAKYLDSTNPQWKSDYSNTEIRLLYLTNDYEAGDVNIYHYNHSNGRVEKNRLNPNSAHINFAGGLGIADDFNKIINKVILTSSVNAVSFGDIQVDSANPYFIEGSIPVVVETTFMFGGSKRTVKTIYRIDIQNTYRSQDASTNSISVSDVRDSVFTGFSAHKHLGDDIKPSEALIKLLDSHPKMGDTGTMKTTLLRQNFYSR